MNVETYDIGCVEPKLADYLAAYCFDDVTEAQAQAFEQHLLVCDACWREVQRLQSCVAALCADSSLKQTLLTNDVLGVLGMSGRLDYWLGGHGVHAVLAAFLYALLYAIPIFVEIAYQFDQFGALALKLAPVAFVWIFSTTLGALWIDWRNVRRGRNGFTAALGVLVAATGLLCIAIVPLFSAEPTVQARFQTYTVQAGYLKSVIYAWLVILPFVLLPFDFVLVMQREIRAGRAREVLALLTGDKRSLPPRGTLYPRFWALALYLVLLFATNYVGVNHLFDNLTPGPYMNLFMFLVIARVVTWLGVAVVCVVWYARALNELKRESRALDTMWATSTSLTHLPN